MGALAIPIISLAVQHVPELLGMLVGDKAGAVANTIIKAAQDIFGTADPAQIAAAEAAKLEQFKAALSALVASDQAQGSVNANEAQSKFFFVAGWRPFIGWVCGVGLAYQFVAFPFLVWLSNILKVAAPPALDISQLVTLLTGMLGLAVVRSYDKLMGTDTTAIKMPGLLGGKK